MRESSRNAPQWKGSAGTYPPLPSSNGRFVVFDDENDFLRPRPTAEGQIGRDVWITGVFGGRLRLVTDNRGDQAHPVIGSRRRVAWLDGARARTDLVTRFVP